MRELWSRESVAEKATCREAKVLPLNSVCDFAVLFDFRVWINEIMNFRRSIASELQLWREQLIGLVSGAHVRSQNDKKSSMSGTRYQSIISLFFFVIDAAFEIEEVVVSRGKPKKK